MRSVKGLLANPFTGWHTASLMEALTRTEEPAGDRLPRRFGRYHLFDRIGRGGMADIYLALASTEIGATRRVVVKQILESLCHDAEFSRLLVEEAKLVAGLRHGNVAQVLDLGREGQRLFIAMEYVEGFDLNQLLRRLSKRRLPLPAEFALFIVREVLAALDFAHRKRDADGQPLGIVHCDVSPSNVLISFEGEVKLCDFGIAKAYGAHGSGGAERVAGKAAYMSPEHARGEPLDARADLFAAGIILHELCAGRRLYKGTEAEMLGMAQRAEIPPLPDRGLRDQATLQSILDRALSPDPAARFENANQMLRALDDYAMRAKLFASQIRFGAFLTDHFADEVVHLRRERERSASAVDLAPADPTFGSSLDTAPDGAERSQGGPRPSLSGGMTLSDAPFGAAPAEPLEAYPSVADSFDADLPSDTVVVDRNTFAEEAAEEAAASDREPEPARAAPPASFASPPAPAADPSPRRSAKSVPSPAASTGARRAAPHFTRPPAVEDGSATPAPGESPAPPAPVSNGGAGKIMLVALIVVAVVVSLIAIAGVGLYLALS